MKNILVILFLMLINNRSLSQDCICDSSTVVKMIKEGRDYLTPTEITDSSFNKLLWGKFHNEISKLEDVDFRIWVSTKGFPSKIEIRGYGKGLILSESNKQKLNKFILKNLRWRPAYEFLKNGQKRFFAKDVFISFEDIIAQNK